MSKQAKTGLSSISRPRISFFDRLFGRNKALFLTAAAIFLLAGAAVATKQYVKTQRQKLPSIGQLAIQGEIDPSLYTVPEREEAQAPAQEPEPSAPEPPAADFSNAPPPPPPPPINLRADEIFATPPVDPVKAKIAAINAASRESLQVEVAGRQATVVDEPTEWINKQDRWNEKQTVSSYPVDMSRTIPVVRYIPAILVDEINSELGGKVRAQVERDVYGGHGRFVLIPAGTMAVGMYEPADKVGQERLEITWQRLITPEGINIHTTKAYMADAMGRSGIAGEVDSRFWDRFGMAMFTTVLTTASAYVLPVENEAQGAIVENLSKGGMSMSSSMLEQTLDMKPRIMVPHGARIMISPVTDIWFKEPTNDQIEVVPLEEVQQ